MQFQIKTTKGVITRNLKLHQIGAGKYKVRVDESREIGTVWKDFGRVKKFRNHRLDGTREVTRWFAATAEGEKLGRVFPYDEGFSTRLEALTELLEKTLKIRRDWR